jgi:hypothetical protein
MSNSSSPADQVVAGAGETVTAQALPRSTVSAAALIRAAGAAEILSGVLNVVFFGLHPAQGEPPPAGAIDQLYAPLHVVGILALVLGMLGLIALYLVQFRLAGRLGLWGFVLTFLGMLGFIGFLWGDGLYSPLLRTWAPPLLDQPTILYGGWLFAMTLAAGVAFNLGTILFAIGSLRARALPRWGIVALTVGSLIVGAPPPPLAPIPWVVLVAGAVILAVGVVWLGSDLWTRPYTRTGPAPSRGG